MSEPAKCLGCKNHFLQNEVLQEEGLTVQMKNYTFPIKNLDIRRILQKTINSMLNTRGGAIYLSVDDATGAVVGQSLNRKEQDLFRQNVEELVRGFNPKVQLSQQQIKTVFLPVLNKQNGFSGRFVPKIIIHPGDPGELYTFNQKITLMQGQIKTEFDVLFAYQRYPSKVKKLGPVEIKEEIVKRTIKKGVKATFHEGCHPGPLEVAAQKKLKIEIKIGAAKLNLANFLQREIEELGLTCKSEVTEDSLFLNFESEEQTEQVKNIINENAAQLAKFILIQIDFKGEIGGIAKFQASEKVKADKQQQQSHRSKSRAKPDSKFSPNPSSNARAFSKERVVSQQITQKWQEEKYYYLFTHLNIHTRSEFQNLILKKYEGVVLKKYQNSMLVCFTKEQQRTQFKKKVLEHKTYLTQKFGFQDFLIYGTPTGQLSIKNVFFDKLNLLWHFAKRVALQAGIKLANISTANEFRVHTEIKDAPKLLDLLIKNPLIRDEFAYKDKKSTHKKLKFILHTE